MQFPDGRLFAFTILDDTDVSTLENVKPVYDRLREYGLRTTKTVWPLDCPEGSENFGATDTLQCKEYLAFVKDLAAEGFELAFHGATMESSRRQRTIRGIEFLEREFGSCPRLHANHAHNRENVYWGSSRFRTAPIRWLVGLLRRPLLQEGEREDSPYFWGDLCRDRIQYVRNFTFRGLNMLKINPEMPYRLASTPYVNHWFSTTDAPDVDAFRERVTREAVDRLEAEGGVCIVSTHFGKGFARDGRLDPEVDELLRYVAAKPGWFVPVSHVLDHLREHRSEGVLGAPRLLRLELLYMLDQLRERLSIPGR